jgi:hypothetical protein
MEQILTFAQNHSTLLIVYGIIGFIGSFIYGLFCNMNPANDVDQNASLFLVILFWPFFLIRFFIRERKKSYQPRKRIFTQQSWNPDERRWNNDKQRTENWDKNTKTWI